MKFPLTAIVSRTVIDTVSIDVEADTEEQATEVARKVLKVFPRAYDQDGVTYCYIEHRDNAHGEVLEIGKRA